MEVSRQRDGVQVSNDVQYAFSTQRHAALFSLLFDITTDAVLSFLDDGTIIAVNEVAARLLQRSASEVVGCNVADILFSQNDEELDEKWCFATDGTACSLSCRTASGARIPVVARCDSVMVRANAGRSYLLTMSVANPELARTGERERLVCELRQANHRLSGMLSIILNALDSSDMEELVCRVLEATCDTMEASGAVIYLAEKGGFRLRGVTQTLANVHIPPFLARGCGAETLAVRAGHTLRLSLMPARREDLRRGHLRIREIIDMESDTTTYISAQYLPPFRSFLCTPIWLNDSVIALLEIGWFSTQSLRREDARLVDVIAQYLSVELMAAFTAMQHARAAEVDAVMTEAVRTIDALTEVDRARVVAAFDPVARVLDALLVPVSVDEHKHLLLATLPDASVALPLPDEGDGEDAQSGCVVMAISGRSVMRAHLCEHSAWSIGAYIDLGLVNDERVCMLLVRSEDAEPFEDGDMRALHSAVRACRVKLDGVKERSNDTHIAQALQQGMKNELQKVRGITTQDIYSSATAAALVGGDFYDLIRLPGRRACVILGDVSGKGIESASVSAAVKTALGAYAWEGISPARMVRSLNEFLLGFSRIETFATLFVGIIDLNDMTITYCSAGHPPVLIMRGASQEITSLSTRSGVVGAFHEMTFLDGHAQLNPGDIMLLYTDGVTEARNPSGAFFGEDGLREVFMREGMKEYAGLLERILATIDAFTECTLKDDVAMMALRFDGAIS